MAQSLKIKRCNFCDSTAFLIAVLEEKNLMRRVKFKCGGTCGLEFSEWISK